jgi:hypothetical protein
VSVRHPPPLADASFCTRLCVRPCFIHAGNAPAGLTPNRGSSPLQTLTASTRQVVAALCIMLWLHQKLASLPDTLL